MAKEPRSVEADDEPEELKRIFRRADALAKEIDELPESTRKRELTNALAALHAIADQFTVGLRDLT